jgi:hypothetical protein
MMNLRPSFLALLSIPALLAAACTGSNESDLAGDVDLATYRGDACDDLHCPMALGTASEIAVLVHSVAAYKRQAGLILISSDEAVVRLDPRPELRAGGAQVWTADAIAPGPVDLTVLDENGDEVFRQALVVEEVARIGLEVERAEDARGPTLQAGIERWSYPVWASPPSFTAVPTTASDERMMGEFSQIELRLADGLTNLLPVALRTVRVDAAAPGIYPVEISVDALSLRSTVELVVE